MFHVVGLPQNHSAAPAGARHSLPAGAVRHSPCAGRQLHFRQSFPWAPTGVSEFARWRRDDDSQKPTWQEESSQPWSAQVEQGGAAQVGRAGTLKAPGDGMFSAQLGPKAWLKGSTKTSPWPNVGNCFHQPFLADSLSLLNVDNILYKFLCNSLFQKLSPVI